MGVTIKDVAKKCGVSVATVSRVINDSSLVGDETKKRVKEVIKELGFVPNRNARGLSTKSTRMIGVIVPDISNSFFGELIEGIDREAAKAGYDIIISNYKYMGENMCKDVVALKSRDVDGFIMSNAVVDENTLDYLVKNKVPFVLTGAINYSHPVNYVGIDNVEGARIAVQHLIDLGHKRIGYISGKRFQGYINRLRLQGYKDCLLENKIDIDEDLIFEGDVQKNLKKILQMDESKKPSAVFTFNDILALEFMEACELGGLKIPKDMALVGFDNIKMASFYSIGLTTVDNGQREFGSQAVKILLENINSGASKTQQIITVPKLIVRRSSGA